MKSLIIPYIIDAILIIGIIIMNSIRGNTQAILGWSFSLVFCVLFISALIEIDKHDKFIV